jgi:hypothetical protein
MSDAVRIVEVDPRDGERGRRIVRPSTDEPGGVSAECEDEAGG